MSRTTRPSRVAARGGFRRALALLVGAIVWPGSAQFIAGRRVLGAIVMTLVAGFGITCAVLWFMYQPSRSDLINAVTSGPALGIARWAFVGVVAAWLLLFIDAWRLATIPNMGIMRKLGVSLLSVVVIAGASGVGFVGWTTASASKKVVESVFTATVEKPPLEGRYNILLVGADSGKGRTGMRPDSMNVVSIDAATGVPVMISLPRNLQKVPFVDGSPMQQIYPYGYNCGTECLLNAVHTAASNRADLYPDSVDPGMSATIDAVEGVTGLSINYHIVVNMKGFSKLVDAIGGVPAASDCEPGHSADSAVEGVGYCREFGRHVVNGYPRHRTGRIRRSGAQIAQSAHGDVVDRAAVVFDGEPELRTDSVRHR